MLPMSTNTQPSITVKSANTWHETVLRLHSHMEEEIIQNMLLYNDIGKVYFFDTLKSWLTEYRIIAVNIPLLSHQIEMYNQKTYDEFLVKVEEEETKFKETFEYKNYHHQQVYQKEAFPIWAYHIKPSHPIMQEVTYHKFICVSTPQLIDTKYLKDYVLLVEELIDNFKGIINFHLAKYEAVSGVPKPPVLKLPPAQKQLEQMKKPNEDPVKLKAKITVEQLTFLFKILYNCNIINAPKVGDIHNFLADHFETISASTISAKNIGKLWSVKTDETIDFWVKKFIELDKEAKRKPIKSK